MLQNPLRWSRNFAGYLQILGGEFEQVTTDATTLENVRDVVCLQLHAVDQISFHLNREVTSIDRVASELLSSGQPVSTEVMHCIDWGHN
jgi:hypothetical protein